ncbi:DUF4334 domain-containing protein [Cellulosimicrobium cellulans]|uniref:DUF4334 domain-containing protein n=1 Tax=Cellulosimicrobium cellulans TaxID=1710 RepID=UPI00084854D9|nr:DUF4334 domain-containing protein [Cellulosimicrobium cellulans]
MDTTSARAGLARLEAGTTTAAALAFYDALPAASPEAVPGTWRGSGLPTGHPLDGVLEALGWYGKRFDGDDDGDGDADPLLFADGRGGTFAVNPAFAPLALVLRCTPVLRRPAVARLVRAALPLTRTRRPRARVRATAFRGVVTATMTYDEQPIDDHFRAVDDDTLLGLMDARGMARPFFFVLRRA